MVKNQDENNQIKMLVDLIDNYRSEQIRIKTMIAEIHARVIPKQTDYMNKKEYIKQIAQNLVNGIK